MKKYYCNDCDDGDQFTGVCEFSPPERAGKPKNCPMFDELIKCNWREM